jgi:hypothetical protein
MTGTGVLVAVAEDVGLAVGPAVLIGLAGGVGVSGDRATVTTAGGVAVGVGVDSNIGAGVVGISDAVRVNSLTPNPDTRQSNKTKMMAKVQTIRFNSLKELLVIYCPGPGRIKLVRPDSI